MKIHLRTKPKITMGCLPALMVSGARKPKGRGRGRTLMQPPSYSSSSLSSDLSLEEDFEKMSVTVQLEKSSDESVLSLTLPPAPQPVCEYLPPRPRITGLFPGGKVATFDTTFSSCK